MKKTSYLAVPLPLMSFNTRVKGTVRFVIRSSNFIQTIDTNSKISTVVNVKVFFLLIILKIADKSEQKVQHL